MSLKKSAIAGVKWTGYSTVITTVLQFVQLAVLARLLSPEAFGLMAIIMLIQGFAQAFTDLGMSNAIIHHQDTTKEQLSSLYWLNIITGGFLFLVIYTMTPLIISFFSEPRLNKLILYSSLIFLIAPFGQQFQVLLQKNLLFKNLSKIEIVSTAIGTLATITLALMNQGVFSIIWGALISVFVKTILLLNIGLRKWCPQLRFRLFDLRNHLKFGLYQMGEKGLNYFTANIDYLLIGRFLGAEALGIYTIAYQLIILPLQKINPILTRVAFPVLARKQNDNSALCSGFLEMTKILLFISLPLLIGLAVLAPIVVPVLLGDKWHNSIILIQILSFVGILKMLGNPVGSIWLAKGRADYGFKWVVFVAVINLLVFSLLVDQGVITIAWSYVALSSLYFVLMQLFMSYTINLNSKIYYKNFISPVIATLVMGLTLQGLISLNLSYINNIPSIIILTLIGGTTYILLMLLMEKKYITKLIVLFLSKSSEYKKCLD